MFKYLTYVFSVLLLSVSTLFAVPSSPMMGPPPPRMDLKAPYTKSAQIKLVRAENILATLVPDPQSYHLMLSSHPSIGAEAVPPFVFSDKPTVIIYQGTLAPSRSNEEAAFVLAHELGHLNLYHNEKMDESMGKVFTGPPLGISGTTFAIYQQKLHEREADQFGLSLYKNAGYDLNFFPFTLKLLKINQNIHFGSSKIFAKPLTSLSMKDAHFNMKERFEFLTDQSHIL